MQQRQSARAILLNDLQQVLLIQHQDPRPVDPARPDLLCYWATPGGGIEAGEDAVEALRRELFEELGLGQVEIERPIGVREVVLDLPEDGLTLSHETYYLCRTAEIPRFNRTQLTDCERQCFRRLRWWSREELVQTHELLRPDALVELIAAADDADAGLWFRQD